MTLLLIPGFMADATLWADMVAPLAPLGPLAYADLGQEESIAAMARRVVAEAPPSFVLVGFSKGGYVAREVARRAPTRVTALVLVATSARADSPELARQKSVAVASGTPFKGLSRAAILSSLHESRAGDEGVVERVRAMGMRLGAGVFARQSRLTRDSDLDRLGEIRCPTLVVAAAEDRLRGLDEARELQAGIPGASLAILEGSGHMLPIEAPDVLARTILEWLAGLGQ
jgi:pimeloyl-ACP methyl ester carboxylesterase